jgi:hypothetical protein
VETKALKQLLKTLRENGVTRYKTPELELDLEPLQAESVGPSSSALPEDRELTPEEIAFYSVTPAIADGEAA